MSGGLAGSRAAVKAPSAEACLFHVKHPMGPDDFRAAMDVSADTVSRLAALLELLVRWQARINLVGPGTMGDPWRRHILDSAQLLPLLPPGTPMIVDLGSGAGFPGLVLAILSNADVHLIEGNARKCAFLREAARVAGAAVTVHHGRIEALRPLSADVVTARGCAPLTALLAYAHRHLKPSGQGVFLKGQGGESELTEASKTWKMQPLRFASRSDASGIVLKITGIAPRHDR